MGDGFRATVKWHASKRSDTIWNHLSGRLGREPTEAEARDEVRRIFSGEDAPPPAAVDQ